MEKVTEMNPLVSVVCVCYNHERFISEAIESVLSQSYQNIELIIVDDASSDNSVAEILRYKDIRGVQIHLNNTNQGNCKTFNTGFRLSSGNFLIDLAGDDVLLRDRVKVGVDGLVNSSAGVQFCNMEVINENGEFRKYYHLPGEIVPEGDVYGEVLARHFIGGASMIIKREVLDKMEGYDEELAYEDFDFWVRSSREFTYQYSPEILVKKRIVLGSKGSRQLSFNSRQLRSTYIVCQKALKLNRSADEHRSLRRRILYEMRKATETGNLKLAKDYLKLLKNVQAAIRTSS